MTKTKDIDRPYFDKKVEELTAIFEANTGSVFVLRDLKKELSFRSTPSAKALAEKVNNALKKNVQLELPKDTPDTTSGLKIKPDAIVFCHPTYSDIISPQTLEAEAEYKKWPAPNANPPVKKPKNTDAQLLKNMMDDVQSKIDQYSAQIEKLDQEYHELTLKKNAPEDWTDSKLGAGIFIFFFLAAFVCAMILSDIAVERSSHGKILSVAFYIFGMICGFFINSIFKYKKKYYEWLNKLNEIKVKKETLKQSYYDMKNIQR